MFGEIVFLGLVAAVSAVGAIRQEINPYPPRRGASGNHARLVLPDHIQPVWSLWEAFEGPSRREPMITPAVLQGFTIDGTTYHADASISRHCQVSYARGKQTGEKIVEDVENAVNTLEAFLNGQPVRKKEKPRKIPEAPRDTSNDWL